MNLVGTWDAVAVEDGIPLGKDIEYLHGKGRRRVCEDS